MKDITHIIQLVDSYLTRHTEDNPKALITMYLYSLLKDEINIEIYFDKLRRVTGTCLLPIVDAINDLVNNHLPNIKGIQDKIKILSIHDTEDEILRQDLENLVIFSIFIELITNRKFNRTIEIIDKDIASILPNTWISSDLIKVIRAKLEKEYQYDSNNDIVLEGLLLIYNLNTNLDEERQEHLKLRLSIWMRDVLKIVGYMQPKSEDILPTPEVIYKVYSCMIILTILNSSIALYQ